MDGVKKNIAFPFLAVDHHQKPFLGGPPPLCHDITKEKNRCNKKKCGVMVGWICLLFRPGDTDFPPLPLEMDKE